MRYRQAAQFGEERDCGVDKQTCQKREAIHRTGIASRRSNSIMVKPIVSYWLPVGAWMALIFVLSAQPQLPGPPPALLFIFGHFVEYGVLALLLLRAVQQSGREDKARTVLWSLAVVALYAASDELHQHFVPGRTPDLWDITWDLAGAGVAVVAWVWLSRIR